jgi:serine/threonine protein kinase/tetratricopeptide (TPR) repeat protein
MATLDRRVNDIVSRAIEAPDPEARRALLDATCAHDHELRRRVEALLHVQEAATSFPDGAPSPPTAEPTTFSDRPDVLGATQDFDPALVPPAPIAEGPGSVIGPYTLRKKIGEGGMGTVFLAEQEKPVRRQVALKVIKPGMDTEQVVGRFEAERQALALMDHPSIARVLDAGATATGRPYFVMELVQGLPITRYCDEARLSLPGRLELFGAVCSAIQHAHQKGVIHRDIKPSNVLVTLVDGEPVPKVIDFGVAKAIGRRLTDRSGLTQHGALVGTLEYMSPEQAGLSGTDVDTRTDIYSLGVLLYELLTGTTPLGRQRLREDEFPEVLRRLKEEEPPRPSARLSDPGTALASIAAARGVEPARLARLVRGDLDWIALKALEKDRARRYDSAAGIARDIRRHLDGDPVEACPPSRSYRLRKFARKHRAALATASAFAALLVAATALSAALAVWARSERRKAEDRLDKLGQANVATEAALRRARAEADKATVVNDFLVKDLLEQAEPANSAVGDRLLLREAVDRAAEKVGDRFRGRPEVEWALRWSLSKTYHGLGAWEKAEAHARAGLDLARRVHGPDSPEAWASLSGLAHMLIHRGRNAEAIDLGRLAADGLVRRLGPDDPTTLAARQYLASAYREAGDAREAVAIQEQVVPRMSAHWGPDHSETLTARHNLASAYRAAGRNAEAIAQLEEVVRLHTAREGADHPDTLVARNTLADAYLAANRVAPAAAMLEDVVPRMTATLGANHPGTLAARNNLASAYRASGRIDDAIALLGEVARLQSAGLGADHPDTLTARNNLATTYRAAGRTAEAIAELGEVVRLRTARQGADHPDTLTTRNNLALAYRAAGRTAEAIPQYEEVVRLMRVRPGADHPDTLVARNNLAVAYRAVGRLEEASAQFEAVVPAYRRDFGPDDPRTVKATANLAEADEALGRWAAAESVWAGLLASTRASSPANGPFLAYLLGQVGRCRLGQSKWAEAEPVLRESLDVLERARPDDWMRFDAMSTLGVALIGQGHHAEAEPLILGGYEGMAARKATIPPPGKPRLPEAAARVVALYEAWGKPEQARQWRAKLGLAKLPDDVFALP